MARCYLIRGQAGQGKSTFALSGEGKTWYCELDPGSYNRAENGIDTSQVEVYQCYPPITGLSDEGRLSTFMTGQGGSGPVKVVHRLSGWDEKALDLRRTYVKALENPEVENVVFDTSTQLWQLIRNSAQERIQDETNISRDALSRAEYDEPNDLMSMITMGAKQMNKNLVLVARESEIYKEGKPTGEFKAAGWGGAPGAADIELALTASNGKPYATVKKAGGADFAMVDLRITEPTIPLMETIIDNARILRSKKVKYPRSVEEIVALGQVVTILDGEEESYECDAEYLLNVAKIRGLYA